MATTAHPGSCPACTLSRWRWVAATTAAAGWRAVRDELADIAEAPAKTETTHDCSRAAGPTLVDDPQPGHCGLGQHRPSGRGRVDRLPLFWAIDRHGTPQTAYPLSVRSITAIVATRLAEGARVGHHPSAAAGPEVTTPAPPWGEDDHARVLAARKAARDRLARFESVLDEADAYAEAILQRLDAELAGARSTEPDNEQHDQKPDER